MDKKGVFGDNFVMIAIIGLVLTIIIFGVWALSITAPLLFGESQVVLNTLDDAINLNPEGTALQNASEPVLSGATNVLGVMELVIYLLFIGGFMGFLVLCYYVRTNKWLISIWILFIVGAVVVAMIVTNAYETAKQDSNLNDFYTQWGNNDFLMMHLPYIILTLGVFGGILLFILADKGESEETQVL